MKKLLLTILISLFLAAQAFAGTLTASNVGFYITNSPDGYYLTYYVTLTQIDADPSNDSHTISSDAFEFLEGGAIVAVAVVSSSADADVGITITSKLGATNTIEWFDEEFAQASLPLAKAASATLSLYPPIIGTGLVIGTDTDWTTAASGDSITVYLVVSKEER